MSSEYNFDEESHNIGNGFSEFSVIGIYSYKEQAIAITEHTFATYDASINDRVIASTSGKFDNRPTPAVVSNNRSCGTTPAADLVAVNYHQHFFPTIQ